MYADVISQFLFQITSGINPCFQRYKRDNALAFQFIRSANYRCLCDSRVTDQRAFYFRCAKSMAGDVENVIDAADDPKITVFIASCAVAREIIAFEFTPVLLAITLFVAVDRAQHRRPWATDDQLATDIRSYFMAFFIDHCRIDAKERKRRATRFGWSRARQRRDHDRAGLSLPPCIDNGTTSSANVFVIPNPRFRIDRFANCA